jgi:ribose/xylose/arabinose/galactoside ABC-type transport system permease subunit
LNRLRISNVNGVFLLVGLGLLVVAAVNPVFLSWNNFKNILLQASIVGTISLGMTLVIIAGGIDLSVGAVAAVAAIVLAKLVGAGFPEFAGVLVALGVGLACGSIIGLCVVAFRVPSFIATLGMLGVARGAALLISDGRPLSDIGAISAFLGSGYVAGIPQPIILFLVMTGAFHFFLSRTIWGTRIYAIGGNIRAAWIAGVPVEYYVGAMYAVCGLMAALAGLVLAGRLGSAQPLAGNLYELDAITAAVLGGATLSGGRGSALGSAAGAILLAALRNAMVIVNLSPFYHQIVIGAVLVAVLLLNMQDGDRGDAYGSGS